MASVLVKKIMVLSNTIQIHKKINLKLCYDLKHMGMYDELVTFFSLPLFRRILTYLQCFIIKSEKKMERNNLFIETIGD